MDYLYERDITKISVSSIGLSRQVIKYSGNGEKQPSSVVWGHVFQQNCFILFSKGTWQKGKEISRVIMKTSKTLHFYRFHVTWAWKGKNASQRLRDKYGPFRKLTFSDRRGKLEERNFRLCRSLLFANLEFQRTAMETW